MSTARQSSEEVYNALTRAAFVFNVNGYKVTIRDANTIYINTQRILVKHSVCHVCFSKLLASTRQ